MTTPPHTLTVPTSDGAAPPPETITWIYERGGERRWPLAAMFPTFAVGASEGCAVRIESNYVSQLHCMIERTSGPRLRVYDRGSKNGTWFGGHRESEFDLRAGDSFQVGMTSLFAATDHMAAARDSLRYYLGYPQARATDDLLQWAVTDEHIVIIGEPASGHEAVARLAHTVSPQRAQPFVVVSEIPSGPAARAFVEQHTGSTIFLMVGDLALGDPFVDTLVDPVHKNRKLRLFAAGTSENQVKAMVSPASHRVLRAVHLPPLRTRKAELRTLLDRAFAMLNLPFHAHDLGDGNLAVLEAHDWPDNLDELAEVAKRVGAVLSTGSERKAATLLGIHPTALARWFDRRGLIFPQSDR